MENNIFKNSVNKFITKRVYICKIGASKSIVNISLNICSNIYLEVVVNIFLRHVSNNFLALVLKYLQTYFQRGVPEI